MYLSFHTRWPYKTGFHKAVIIMVLVRNIWVFKRLKLCMTGTKIIFEYNIIDILKNVYLVWFQSQHLVF